VIGLNGSGLRILKGGYWHHGDPVYSPMAGGWRSTVANRPNGAIYQLTLNGTGHTRQIRKLTHPPFPLEDWATTYAPLGDRIVFTSDRLYPGRDGADLFLMRRDGSGVHGMALPPALDQLYVEWPSWGTAPLMSGGSTAEVRPSQASREARTRVPFRPRGGVAH
jgi:hypothetical protein